MRNRIPTRKNGILIHAIPRRLKATDWKLCIKIYGLKPRPIVIKIMPPINSHFQAIIRKISKINDGMRCLKKAPIFCQIVIPCSKASKANKLIKRMARIQIILGNP